MSEPKIMLGKHGLRSSNPAAVNQIEAIRETAHRAGLSGKRLYKPPTLTKYGNVARLTAACHGTYYDNRHTHPHW